MESMEIKLWPIILTPEPFSLFKAEQGLLRNLRPVTVQLTISHQMNFDQVTMICWTRRPIAPDIAYFDFIRQVSPFQNELLWLLPQHP